MNFQQLFHEDPVKLTAKRLKSGKTLMLNIPGSVLFNFGITSFTKIPSQNNMVVMCFLTDSCFTFSHEGRLGRIDTGDVFCNLITSVRTPNPQVSECQLGMMGDDQEGVDIFS